jgi:hypothetical protein
MLAFPKEQACQPRSKLLPDGEPVQLMHDEGNKRRHECRRNAACLAERSDNPEILSRRGIDGGDLIGNAACSAFEW